MVAVTMAAMSPHQLYKWYHRWEICSSIHFRWLKVYRCFSHTVHLHAKRYGECLRFILCFVSNWNSENTVLKLEKCSYHFVCPRSYSIWPNDDSRLTQQLVQLLWQLWMQRCIRWQKGWNCLSECDKKRKHFKKVFNLNRNFVDLLRV